MMKVLIIGEGGREHALCWKAAQSNQVQEIFVAPGNAGTALEAKTTNISIEVSQIVQLVDFCKDENIDLCIVGPEGPLVAGITDQMQKAGVPCFGPNQKAAQLEGSKAFAKRFLMRHGIPTASYAQFSDYSKAVEFVKTKTMPLVIKADGLAAGKGVIIVQTIDEAKSVLDEILRQSTFGGAGASVVIEEFLCGEEASFICMVSGEQILPLATSQDHKAAYDGDKGPNTGGMGAYSPAPIVDAAMFDKIMDQVIKPTVAGLKADGITYTGFLYAGIMIDDNLGIPNVLEFNCRLGDPETQPIMMRLDSDIVELCLSAIQKKLPNKAKWRDEVALGVVLAAKGYPSDYAKGYAIEIDQRLENLPNVKLFHAGTKMKNNQLVTQGGRVMCACALGDTLIDAQNRAYQASELVHWDGIWFRHDIGFRALP